jgi:hypothetical protein
MGFIARHHAAPTPFTAAIALEALERVLPAEVIQAAATGADVPTKRRRKLPNDVTLLLCVAMGLFAQHAMDVVLRKMVQGLRLLWPEPDIARARKSAISQARSRLGARPVVALFHRVCRPLATVQTPGAFLFGLRLMALDGTGEDVPDTPANARAFGRPHGERGASAFPQLQGVDLSECGTHAVTDAGFWPCHTSERVGAFRLLRSVGAGMLLLLDRGCYSFEMIDRAHRGPWRPCPRARPGQRDPAGALPAARWLVLGRHLPQRPAAPQARRPSAGARARVHLERPRASGLWRDPSLGHDLARRPARPRARPHLCLP